MKLYISGPMAGIADLNFPAFDALAKELRAAGHEVLSPAENSRLIYLEHGGKPAFDAKMDPQSEERRQFFMREDTKLVLQAEGIVVLPGWFGSRGATYEIVIAKELGLPIYGWMAMDTPEHRLIEIHMGLHRAAEYLFVVEHLRRHPNRHLSFVETDLSSGFKATSAWDYGLKYVRPESPEVIEGNAIQLANKEQHLADLYDVLGVKWGDDPFAVIQKLQQKAFMSGQAAVAIDTDAARFQAVWNVIKEWDLSTEQDANGDRFYAGATGTQVQAILDALGPIHVGTSSGVKKGDPEESIALEADRLVDGARQKDYGHPLDNYEKVAHLFNAYLYSLGMKRDMWTGMGLTAENIIDLMVLVKLGRLMNGPHRDSIVDIAGYAKCRDLCRTERKRRDGAKNARSN